MQKRWWYDGEEQYLGNERKIQSRKMGGSRPRVSKQWSACNELVWTEGLTTN